MTSKPLCLLPATETTPSVTPHLLPFHLSYNGPAPITRYFALETDKTDLSLSTASFRGRYLVGKPFPLPSGYSGLICSLDKPVVSLPFFTPEISTTPVKSNKRRAPSPDSDDAPPQDTGRRMSPRKHARSNIDTRPIKKARVIRKKEPVQKFSMDDSDEEELPVPPKVEVAVTHAERIDMVIPEIVIHAEEDPAPADSVHEEVAMEAIVTEETVVQEAVLKESVAIPESTPDASTAVLETAHEELPIAASSPLSSLPPSSPTKPSIEIPPSSPLSSLPPSSPPKASTPPRAAPQPSLDPSKRYMKPISTFNEIFFWNPDEEGDWQADIMIKGMTEWAVIANAIHC